MNNLILRQELEKRIDVKLDEIRNLFHDKNAQYSTDDAFANFTAGGRLMFRNDEWPGKYEALKSYVLKHIAQVYNNGIDGHKVDESVKDIVVYFLLASVMIDLNKEDDKE